MAPSLCVVQFEDRPPSELGLQSRLPALNRQKCEAEAGCSYILHTDASDAPSYWQKVLLARRYLRSGSCSVVIWLDSDAVVHTSPRRVSELLDGKAMAIPREIPKWGGPFNAGAWAIAATPAGLRIMDDWAALWQSASARWQRHGPASRPAWKCDGCRWAFGPWYEQGAFIDSILPEHGEHVRSVDWSVLNNPCPREVRVISLS